MNLTRFVYFSHLFIFLKIKTQQKQKPNKKNKKKYVQPNPPTSFMNKFNHIMDKHIVAETVLSDDEGMIGVERKKIRSTI